MANIKVVGDIRFGNYQPSLTGNPVVDSALVANFCDRLASWLATHHIKSTVIPEHAFQLSDVPTTDDLYVVDNQILKAFDKQQTQQSNVLGVNHQDLLHANPTAIYRQILDTLQH